MESTGLPMKIQMSQETTDILERVGFLQDLKSKVLLHSFNLARLEASHMSRGGSYSFPRSSFLQMASLLNFPEIFIFWPGWSSVDILAGGKEGRVGAGRRACPGSVALTRLVG